MYNPWEAGARILGRQRIVLSAAVSSRAMSGSCRCSNGQRNRSLARDLGKGFRSGFDMDGNFCPWVPIPTPSRCKASLGLLFSSQVVLSVQCLVRMGDRGSGVTYTCTCSLPLL